MEETYNINEYMNKKIRPAIYDAIGSGKGFGRKGRDRVPRVKRQGDVK